MSVTHFDSWQDPIFICKDYIQYRQRIITRDAIDTFRVKNRRFLINHYKNEMAPTMCIMFDSDKEAMSAFNDMRDLMLESEDEQPVYARCFTRLSKFFSYLF